MPAKPVAPGPQPVAPETEKPKRMNTLRSETFSSPTTDRRLSLTEATYLRLREEVLTCQIKPGQRLVINDLTEHLGASLGAVREALSRLTSEGLVVSEAQRGFTCAPVSITDLMELTRTRVEIESICMKWAIEQGSIAWESQIVGAYHQMVRLDELSDEKAELVSEDWARAHSRFHETLVAGCNNACMLRIRRNLYEQSERYRRLSIPLRVHTVRDDHIRAQELDHKALMQAALDRDADSARAVMAEHLMRTARLVSSLPTEQVVGVWSPG